MDETPASREPSPELPYPMAKRLRDQGLSDTRILAELQRTGLSTTDARFVIDSLPGGTLERGTGDLSSGDGNASSPSGGFPITGFIMTAAGILITVGSYASAAPGGSYLISWGLVPGRHHARHARPLIATLRACGNSRPSGNGALCRAGVATH
jgi:hypothetical protein